MTTPETLEVAVLQLNSQGEVPDNLEACSRVVRAAAARGAELVVLPENFAYLGPETGKRELAERLGDRQAPIQAALVEMAVSNRVTLVAGGWPEASSDPKRPYNSCLVLSPEGEHVANYRKIHLFDVTLPDGQELLESVAVTPGDEVVVASIRGFRVGLSICYDLRFPELYRRLVDQQAEVLLAPAAFTLQTGKDHWHVLLRARAIESQCWVAAAAQWGKHPKGRASYGHAMIVDPWGCIVAECSDRVGFVMATVDRSYLAKVRGSVPSLSHRRL